MDKFLQFGRKSESGPRNTPIYAESDRIGTEEREKSKKERTRAYEYNFFKLKFVKVCLYSYSVSLNNIYLIFW